MKKLLAALVLLVVASGTGAQVINDNDVFKPSSSFTPSCSQSTTFIARTSGLSNGQKTAYDTMICGLVTDSIIDGNMGSTGCGSLIDIFYIFASSSTTNALLNLCGTAYPAVETSGPISFSANNGYTFNGTSQYLTTSGYIPGNAGNTCGNGSATCHSTVNTGTGGVYIGSSRTIDTSVPASWGVLDANVDWRLIISTLLGGNSKALYSINTGVAQNSVFVNASVTNTQGFWIMIRASGVSSDGRQYSSGGPYTGGGDATGSSAFGLSRGMLIGAQDNNGSVVSFSTDLTQAFFMGDKLTNTQADNMSSRVNQFMIDVGATYHY